MRNRTIITNVKPSFDGKNYFIKKVAGELVLVSAVVFTDGDDPVSAALLYKKENAKKWFETPMNQESEDVYSGNFPIETEGFYQFKIEAWTGNSRQHATVYDRDQKVRVGRAKEVFSTWYQMFPRSSSQMGHGTFKDCQALLPRLAELGFDTLLFPPIFPIGETNRKGRDNRGIAQKGDPGSPWSAGDKSGGHKTVHRELGSIRDFENLLEAASKHGLEIALDMGLRCSPDHPYVAEHPDWFHRTADGNLLMEEKPPLSYSDVINFNFECDDWKNLWEELKSIVLFWAGKGVRIFYASTPHNKPFAFWQWLIQEIQGQYPESIFISGAFTRPIVTNELAKAGFTQSFVPFLWKSNREEIEALMETYAKGDSKEYLRPLLFTNTPDLSPVKLLDGNENAYMLRYALAATLSSNCGIYGPVFELMENANQSPEAIHYLHSEKYEIVHHAWDERNRITALIAKLNQIRKDNPALQHTFNITFTRTDNDNLLSFVKSMPDGSNTLWCIINLDPKGTQSGNVEVPREVLGIKTRWFNLEVHDLVSGETYHWFNDWNFVELKPEKFPLHILKVVQ